MPIPQALVIRYFQLLVNKQFTEAERELDRVKQKMQKTEWNRGYFRALYGMYLARKANGDSYAFFTKLDLGDKVALHTYRKEFLAHLESKLHADFDHGYFAAWADCMRVLSRIDIPNLQAPVVSGTDEKKLETVKADMNQSTMENFLEEEE